MKAAGRSLWEAVVYHLQLVECDYFGLQYEDSHGLKVELSYNRCHTHARYLEHVIYIYHKHVKVITDIIHM